MQIASTPASTRKSSDSRWLSRSSDFIGVGKGGRGDRHHPAQDGWLFRYHEVHRPLISTPERMLATWAHRPKAIIATAFANRLTGSPDRGKHEVAGNICPFRGGFSIVALDPENNLQENVQSARIPENHWWNMHLVRLWCSFLHCIYSTHRRVNCAKCAPLKIGWGASAALVHTTGVGEIDDRFGEYSVGADLVRRSSC